MFRAIVTASSLVIVLAGLAAGQDGEKPLFAEPAVEKKDETTRIETPSRPSVDPRVERMSAWPDAAGVDAARDFVRMGRKAVPTLLENLTNRDWRIRCGCAFALGELRERSALPALREALRDVANRISMGPFFDALVKIDAVAGTGDVLPFLTSKFPRTAVAAYEAVPEVVNQAFEKDLRELLRSRTSEVRARVLDLLTRLEEPVEPAVFIDLLGDPSSRIAKHAADILATSEADVQAALTDVALSGTMRRSSYALLALVAMEDRSNRVVLEESEAMIVRLFQLMKVPGELENAVGAIALANLSMRCTDERVRRVTDEHVVLYLLHAAAGGRLFKDYLSVRDMCFRKAQMLTGESFGQDADRWIGWWKENHEGFRARRELRGVGPSDHDLLSLTLAYRPESGDELRVVLRGGTPHSSRRGSVRPVWMNDEDIAAIKAALESYGFFEGRGSARDADWTGPYFEATVSVGRASFTRAEYGEIPDDALEFMNEVQAVVDRNAWQAFRNSEVDPDPQKWIEANRARMAALPDAERDELLAELGLDAYHDLDRRGRAMAIGTWRRRDSNWLRERADRLISLLAPTSAWARPTPELLELVGRVPGSEITTKVMESLPLFSDDGRELALAFLGPRPLEDVLAITSSSSPDVLTVAIRELARRDHPRAAEHAVSLAGDADHRVRTAFVEAYSGEVSARVLPLIFARMDRLDGAGLRAMVELAGAVGGERSVARLSAAYADADLPLRRSIIRALGAAASPGAVDRLLEIGREDAEPIFRSEAIAMLGDMPRDVVHTRYKAALAAEQRPDRLQDLLSGAVAVFGEDVGNELAPFIAHEDAGVRRVAALVMAPHGVGATVPALLELLVDRPMTTRARELLELVTGYAVDEPTAEGARLKYELWWEVNKESDRLAWVMASFDEQGYPAAALGAFRRGRLQDPAALTVLLRAVRSDVWHIRQNAHLMLSASRGSPIGSLDRDASPAEIERNASRWETWFRTIREKL